MIHRRGVLAGMAALGGLAGCARPTAATGDVVAAGQPAAILIAALAPERLAGWPRLPGEDALATLPAVLTRREVGALNGSGAPAGLEAVAALRPRLILDYGDAGPDHLAIAERTRARLGAPYELIDGALEATPGALRRAGGLLGVAARGETLARAAEAVLADWRRPAGSGPAFYYARGEAGLETGFRGGLASQTLEGAGWTNVATGEGDDTGRVSAERIAAWDPEIVVTMDTAFAARAAEDPFWRSRVAGGRRRLLLLPELPFGWMDRPPSVNRLVGCAWLTGAGGQQRAATLETLLWGQPSGSRPRMIA